MAFGQLLRASDVYQGGPVVQAALAIVPILFQRPGNLRTMRWADIDLDAARWTIPSADMKRTVAEKHNGQPHVVPLPRQVLNTLRELQPLTGHREYVFPGFRDPTKPMSEAASMPRCTRWATKACTAGTATVPRAAPHCGRC
ncbi:MAG: tyrosine-type recombinase/integrase [Burkholderiaceae bacterium]|nr:tyrosine-type recombinase/integrase [Burkholderiaceae bacterium]